MWTLRYNCSDIVLLPVGLCCRDCLSDDILLAGDADCDDDSDADEFRLDDDLELWSLDGDLEWSRLGGWFNLGSRWASFSLSSWKNNRKPVIIHNHTIYRSHSSNGPWTFNLKWGLALKRTRNTVQAM